jgi:hypothetical protein
MPFGSLLRAEDALGRHLTVSEGGSYVHRTVFTRPIVRLAGILHGFAA